jgi:hypothetical protein
MEYSEQFHSLLFTSSIHLLRMNTARFFSLVLIRTINIRVLARPFLFNMLNPSATVNAVDQHAFFAGQTS